MAPTIGGSFRGCRVVSLICTIGPDNIDVVCVPEFVNSGEQRTLYFTHIAIDVLSMVVVLVGLVVVVVVTGWWKLGSPLGISRLSAGLAELPFPRVGVLVAVAVCGHRLGSSCLGHFLRCSGWLWLEKT